LIPEDGENLNSRKLPIAYFADGKFWVNNHAHIVRSKPGKADDVFLKHALNAKDISGYVTGAAQPKLSQANLKRMTIDLPPLEIQRRIGLILGAYDDLIKVNRRRVAVVEEMARALFDEAITRTIGCLPPPGGGAGEAKLPDGWELAELSAIAEIVMGQSPSSDELNKDGVGIPFHQGVSDFGDLFPKRRVFCARPNMNKVAKAGDILFSVRAPVGRINLAAEDILLGRGVSSITSSLGNQPFLVQYLRAVFHEPDLIGNGAIYKAVGRKDIERIPVALPPSDERDRLSRTFEPLHHILWVLERSNANLAASRDLLLPRLISGQLSVEAAERELEDAA